MDQAKRANQLRNAKHSKRVVKDAFSKELDETEVEIAKLKKQKEELINMAKEKAKPVFKRNMIPLRPDIYRQPTPLTDPVNAVGNSKMPFQRGASVDYDLYCPSQEIMNTYFPAPPSTSINYSHFVPPNPPPFDPFQAATSSGLEPHHTSHTTVPQSSRHFPDAAVDYADDHQYWDVIDGPYVRPARLERITMALAFLFLHFHSNFVSDSFHLAVFD
jgi:hypothetical protein